MNYQELASQQITFAELVTIANSANNTNSGFVMAKAKSMLSANIIDWDQYFEVGDIVRLRGGFRVK